MILSRQMIPRLVQSASCSQLLVQRHLSVNQTAVALRPFYFTVHPDLFGQHPKERKVNEDSLKQLSEHFRRLHTEGRADSTQLIFYVRHNTSPSKGQLQRISIKLSTDIRRTLVDILKACGLSLDYITTIKDTKPAPVRPIRWEDEFEDLFYTDDSKRKSGAILSEWLKKNIPRANKYAASIKPLKKETEKVRSELIKQLDLADICWESSWKFSHFIACLKSFQRLSSNHRREMQLLRGRKVIFTNATGVSIHNHVLLGNETVPHNWFKMIANIQQYKDILAVLPHYQQMLTEYLNNISIQQPASEILAIVYLRQLEKLVGSLKRHSFSGNQPHLQGDFSHLQLLVESGAGPLSLSPVGQISVPVSCPPSLLIQFLMDHKAMALELLQAQTSLEIEEAHITASCINDIGLKQLTKDGNISSKEMLGCCRRLHRHCLLNHDMLHSLEGASINVSSCYSVMEDGKINIPWDWKHHHNS